MHLEILKREEILHRSAGTHLWHDCNYWYYINKNTIQQVGLNNDASGSFFRASSLNCCWATGHHVWGFVVFTSPSRKMLKQHLKLCQHNSFYSLSNPSFINHSADLEKCSAHFNVQILLHLQVEGKQES